MRNRDRDFPELNPGAEPKCYTTISKRLLHQENIFLHQYYGISFPQYLSVTPFCGPFAYNGFQVWQMQITVSLWTKCMMLSLSEMKTSFKSMCSTWCLSKVHFPHDVMKTTCRNYFCGYICKIQIFIKTDWIRYYGAQSGLNKTDFCKFEFKGTNGRQKTYEIFHVYCIFYSGFMCQTTIIFGITKDGSLESNNLASWNCFTCRNLFQNGANDMSECLTFEMAFSKKAQNFV